MDLGPSEKDRRISEVPMKRVPKEAFGILIGIILIGNSVFAADRSSKDGTGIEIKTPESSNPEGSKNIEQLLMEGTEIQGTLEKPHVVYVIPWKQLPPSIEEGVPIRRNFKNEILEPVDREQFQERWRNIPRHPK